MSTFATMTEWIAARLEGTKGAQTRGEDEAPAFMLKAAAGMAAPLAAHRGDEPQLQAASLRRLAPPTGFSEQGERKKTQQHTDQ